ncbi:unnamed protein product, partial [Musa textilis]
ICRSHIAFADPGSSGSDWWSLVELTFRVGVGVGVAVKIVPLFLSHVHQHRMGLLLSLPALQPTFTEPLAKQSTISQLHLSFLIHF